MRRKQKKNGYKVRRVLRAKRVPISCIDEGTIMAHNK